MKEPVWLQREFVLVLHERMVAAFGGLAGVRDEGMLESALGRPQYQFAYERPSHFGLAAAYAFGITRNHPFLDGNKRTGLIAAATFLERNGYSFRATEAEATAATLALAEGTLTEAAFAAWLGDHTTKAKQKTPKKGPVARL